MPVTGGIEPPRAEASAILVERPHDSIAVGTGKAPLAEVLPTSTTGRAERRLSSIALTLLRVVYDCLTAVRDEATMVGAMSGGAALYAN